jgi:NAD(P)-dependent dehydrogenase (short-subunit alcohol dehydrogenase family)
VTLILVTGASTGLGLATATALAAAGHDVVLHARNPNRIDDTSVLGTMREVVYGDLSSLNETLQVADQVNAIGTFQAVIHNAGVVRGPAVLSVNTVAPFVLTALVPATRLIYLSSSMHMSGSQHLDALDLVNGSKHGRSYDDSKLYVTTLAMAVARRRSGVLSHAVDPGWVPTRMGGRGAPDDLHEGYRTQLWLATAPDSEISPRSGGYWYHHRPRRPHPAALDITFQDELIAELESHTGVSLDSVSPA